MASHRRRDWHDRIKDVEREFLAARKAVREFIRRCNWGPLPRRRPRAEEQVGTTPCPVCATPISGGALPLGPPEPPPAADPTRGLPADVSQLAAHPADGSRDTVIGLGAFLVGGLAGVLALLA